MIHTLEGRAFSNLVEKIDQYAEGKLILMGDFNAVMEETMDKSVKSSTHSTMLQVFLKWLIRTGMIDVW